jgi:hypothetical protein
LAGYGGGCPGDALVFQAKKMVVVHNDLAAMPNDKIFFYACHI